MRSAPTERLPCVGAILLLLALTSPSTAHAQDVRLLVQRSPLAGYRYHEAPQLMEHLSAGEPLDLVREANNPFDDNAVRVEWQGHKLGYVPRTQNAALAWAMDRGEHVEARVAARTMSPRRRKVEFEVFLR